MELARLTSAMLEDARCPCLFLGPVAGGGAGGPKSENRVVSGRFAFRIVGDTLEAMTELCLQDAAARSRSSWGLNPRGRGLLVLDPSVDDPAVESMLDAVEKWSPRTRIASATRAELERLLEAMPEDPEGEPRAADAASGARPGAGRSGSGGFGGSGGDGGSGGAGGSLRLVGRGAMPERARRDAAEAEDAADESSVTAAELAMLLSNDPESSDEDECP